MKEQDVHRTHTLMSYLEKLGFWPVVVLLVSAMFTYVSWNFSKESSEKRDNLHFLRLLDTTEEAILSRLDDFESALWAGVGFLKASDEPHIENWQRFVESLQLAKFFTGSLGLGFIENETKDDSSPSQSLHEIFPEFHLDKNDRGLGIHEYPMMAVTRDAAEKRKRAAWLAADLGKSVVTERIDFGGPKQEAGFFFLAPVYYNESSVGTVEDRRRNLRGWVFTAFTAANLFGEIGQRGLGEVVFEVFEAPAFTTAAPVFSSFPETLPPRLGSIERTRTISFGNRQWLIRWRTTDLFERRSLRSSPQVVLVLGFFGSLSLTLIALIIQLSRSRAMLHAHQAELALKSSQEQFQLAMIGASDLLWHADLVTKSVAFSERWRDLLYHRGESPADLLLFLKNRVHPDDLVTLNECLNDHLKNRTPFKIDFRAFTSHGRYFWFIAKGQAVWDESGNPLRMAGSISDISTRKFVEERLRVTLQSLSRSNRELADFASVASHDLQEPLRKVQAFASLLQENLKHKDPETLDITRRICDAAARMQKLIHDLLQLAKIDTSAQAFTMVNLNFIVADVLGDLELRIKETRAIIKVPELPSIEAEPTQMRQLFQNLLGNAIKFSARAQQPEVTILCHIQEQETSDGQTHQWAIITICDNGIGFDEKQLPRIFKVFQRLHARSDYEGSGIGLSICRRIVERHSGQITARSSPGAGAQFVVQLPFRQPVI